MTDRNSISKLVPKYFLYYFLPKMAIVFNLNYVLQLTKLLDAADIAYVIFDKKIIHFLILIDIFNSTKHGWLRYYNFFCLLPLRNMDFTDDTHTHTHIYIYIYIYIYIIYDVMDDCPRTENQSHNWYVENSMIMDEILTLVMCGQPGFPISIIDISKKSLLPSKFFTSYVSLYQLLKWFSTLPWNN